MVTIHIALFVVILVGTALLAAFGMGLARAAGKPTPTRYPDADVAHWRDQAERAKEGQDKALAQLSRAEDLLDRVREKIGKEVITYAIATPAEEENYGPLWPQRRLVFEWDILEEATNRKYIEARFNHLLATGVLDPEDYEIVERVDYQGEWRGLS